MTNYIKWIYVDVITYPCHKPGACLMLNNEMIRTDNTGQLAVLQISSKVSHIGLQWQNTKHVHFNRGVVWLHFKCIRVSGYILSDNNSYTIRSIYWWIVCAMMNNPFRLSISKLWFDFILCNYSYTIRFYHRWMICEIIHKYATECAF